MCIGPEADGANLIITPLLELGSSGNPSLELLLSTSFLRSSNSFFCSSIDKEFIFLIIFFISCLYFSISFFLNPS